MRYHTAVPSTSVRSRSSLLTKTSAGSIFGVRFVRTALLVTTVGFAGLAASAMASDANATGGSSTALDATPKATPNATSNATSNANPHATTAAAAGSAPI